MKPVVNRNFCHVKAIWQLGIVGFEDGGCVHFFPNIVG
jgi:hypothetical protein